MNNSLLKNKANVKLPLDKEEWHWIRGGYTICDFEPFELNIDSTPIRLSIPDDVLVNTALLYEFIEEMDHYDILGLINKEYGKEVASAFDRYLTLIRAVLAKEWKKNFTGDLPHLK